MKKIEFPAEITPLNIKAYLMEKFSICGCINMGAYIEALVKLLEWHNSIDNRCGYNELYKDIGVFYILAQLLDNLGLTTVD